MSCCSGKGGSIWDNAYQYWKCADCGALKSNDPNYLYGGKYRDELSDWFQPQEVTTNKSKCECGSSTVGSDRHSIYCPLFEDMK